MCSRRVFVFVCETRRAADDIGKSAGTETFRAIAASGRAPRRYNRAMTSPDLTFVLGGARSGKSAYAERLAAASGRPVTYIATARSADADPEFAARIAHHQACRPAHWTLVEADAALPQALRAADGEQHCVLVDCLTLWLAGLVCPVEGGEPPPSAAASRFDELEAALSGARGRVIVVSNEIGLGVVPLGSLTRHYVDELGRLNQRVARIAREVTLMVAGLPVAVKPGPTRP